MVETPAVHVTVVHGRRVCAVQLKLEALNRYGRSQPHSGGPESMRWRNRVGRGRACGSWSRRPAILAWRWPASQWSEATAWPRWSTHGRRLRRTAHRRVAQPAGRGQDHRPGRAGPRRGPDHADAGLATGQATPWDLPPAAAAPRRSGSSPPRPPVGRRHRRRGCPRLGRRGRRPPRRRPGRSCQRGTHIARPRGLRADLRLRSAGGDNLASRRPHTSGSARARWRSGDRAVAAASVIWVWYRPMSLRVGLDVALH